MKTKKVASISFEHNDEWIKCGSLLAKGKELYLHMDSIPLGIPCICRPFIDATYIQGDVMSGDSKIGWIYSDSNQDSEWYVLIFISAPTGSRKQFSINRKD